MDHFKWWELITPVAALVVSITGLLANRKNSTKNLRLSIQQAIFRTIREKAKDCNDVWCNEPESEKNETSPHYLVVNELVITKEVIERSIILFS